MSFPKVHYSITVFLLAFLLTSCGGNSSDIQNRTTVLEGSWKSPCLYDEPDEVTSVEPYTYEVTYHFTDNIITRTREFFDDSLCLEQPLNSTSTIVDSTFSIVEKISSTTGLEAYELNASGITYTSLSQEGDVQSVTSFNSYNRYSIFRLELDTLYLANGGPMPHAALRNTPETREISLYFSIPYTRQN